MRYIEYQENKKHGTKDFPFAYYYVTANHPRYFMPHHWHHDYELIHVFEGSFHLTINQQEYILLAGDTAFIQSGDIHGGVPDQCVYSCTVFNLDELLSANAWAADIYQKLTTYNLPMKPFYSASIDSIRTSIESICSALSQKYIGYRFTVVGAIYQFLGYLFQENLYVTKGIISKTQQKKMKQLKSVLSFISTHYGEDISLEELSRCANMNSNYFCKAFKDLTHKTPMDYLNYYRIESACEQLATTNKSMTEIALSCGYHDSSYFTKVFKKYKNVSPSEYLKNL